MPRIQFNIYVNIEYLVSSHKKSSTCTIASIKLEITKHAQKQGNRTNEEEKKLTDQNQPETDVNAKLKQKRILRGFYNWFPDGHQFKTEIWKINLKQKQCF